MPSESETRTTAAPYVSVAFSSEHTLAPIRIARYETKMHYEQQHALYKKPAWTDRIPIVCANPDCRKVHYYSPSRAAERKYCSVRCGYNARHEPSVALWIIRLLGGAEVVARRLKTTRRAVSEWSRRGIPVKYHYNIVSIARREGLSDSITFEGLQRTTAEGHTYCARMAATRSTTHARS